jgi:phospholipase C
MSNDDRDDSPRTPPGPTEPPEPPQPLLGRRTATAALGALAGAALAGCADDEATSTAGSSGSGGGGSATGGGGSTSTSGSSTGGSPTATTGSSTASGEGGGGEGGRGEGGEGEGGNGTGGDGGEACTRTSDLTPAQLLAGIDTIVVLCMENRSFDHYLGALTLVEGRSDVDGLTGDESNLDGQGGSVPVYLLENFQPFDPPHGWEEVHAQWNGGANDGFVYQHMIRCDAEGEVCGPEVMGYHVRDQLPITYALADAGAVCDRFFCSVLGPTWPNRFYLHGGTSGGEKGNFPTTSFDTIFTLCEDAGLSFNNFYHDIPWRAGAYLGFSGNTGVEEFFERASQGTLPNVSIIDPQFFGDGANDDHPDHHVFLGQALIAAVYQALAQSPQWGRCLFILTYDEHGGFYDHVPPPEAPDEEPEFQQMGFRVPTIVCGPFVRRGCAVSTVFDHTSIIKTIATRWGLPNLSERMAAANDMSSCIDPGALDNPRPPTRLPAVPVVMSAVFGRTPKDAVPHDHKEMWEAAESGRIPPWQDRRADGDRIALHVLEEGERLGVVRLIR